MSHSFEGLVTPPQNFLYGLFKDNHLITVAGYSVFPGGHAMLGRLRSDTRFRKSGYATQLLSYIIDQLNDHPGIHWIGGNTNIGNLPAQRILKKLGFEKLKTLYSFPLLNPELLLKTVGPIWLEITDLSEKRNILKQLEDKGIIDIYPYECYYPFPYSEALLPDEKLAETRFYQNEESNRWLIISDDQKGEAYAQVRYFWDDYFSQAGLFETIAYDLSDSNNQERKAWFDFSETAVDKISNLDAFEVSDGWILYGKKI